MLHTITVKPDQRGRINIRKILPDAQEVRMTLEGRGRVIVEPVVMSLTEAEVAVINNPHVQQAINDIFTTGEPHMAMTIEEIEAQQNAVQHTAVKN